MSWGTKIEREKHKRIRLSLAAYSYEFRSHSIMSDGEYDELSRQINPEIKTGHRDLDEFFMDGFDPNTGMWIHRHPELHKVEALYKKLYRKK